MENYGCSRLVPHGPGAQDAVALGSGGHARRCIRTECHLPVGRHHPFFHLRHHQDRHSAMRDDLHHQLHTELLPSRTQQAHPRALQGNRRQHSRCTPRHRDTVLRLLVHPAVHRVHASGTASRCHVLIPHLISHGGHRLHHPHHEYLRPARGAHLHDGGPHHRRGRRLHHPAPEHDRPRWPISCAARRSMPVRPRR